MRFTPGSYRVTLPAGTAKIIVSDAAAFETWFKSQQAQAVGRISQGGDVGQYKQTVRPSASDGPWWLVSQNPDGSDFNITTGLPSVASAMSQAITDGGNILAIASGNPKNIDIFTTF